MIGATYRGKAAAAILGPDRSGLFPAVLWLSAATAAGTEVTGRVRVDAGAWQIVGDGVANTTALDAGDATESGSVTRLILWDAATAGEPVLEAACPAVSVSLGDALAVPAGGLTFEVSA